MTDRVLTKDEIKHAEDIHTEQVPVPEWNGAVIVKTMTGRERDQLEADVVGPKGERNMANLRAKIVSLSVVDIDGKRMFTYEEAAMLGEKSASALDKIFAVAQRLSGLSKEDVDELSKK